MVSGLLDRVSFNLSHLHYETNGFRVNNDFEKDIYNGFLQFDASPSFAIQGELRKFSSERGDQVLRFDPELFFLDRGEFDGNYARLGARWTPGVQSNFLFSAIWIDAENVAKAEEFRISEKFRTNSLEAQYLWRSEPVNLTIGGGNYRQHKKVDTSFDFQDSNALNARNFYIYGTIKNRPSTLSIQLGASYEKVDAETGITIETQRQLNPKLGIVWNVSPNATVRLASMRTLKRRFLSSQTLEPTQVAGFNQFYDDFSGTDARRYGLGFDYKFSSVLFGGWEASIRNLRVPQAGEFFDWRERLGQGYLYWTPTTWLSGSVALEYEKLTRDPLLPGAELFLNATTRSIPFSIVLARNSVTAKLKATFVSQTGLFYTAPLSADASEGKDQFWISDASFSYLFPRLRGSVDIEIRNLFDKNFNFQETDVVHPRFARGRLFIIRGTASF